MFKVRFHPSHKDSLVTGSVDGLVCLFDISEASEDDALLQTFNPDVAIVRNRMISSLMAHYVSAYSNAI